MLMLCCIQMCIARFGIPITDVLRVLMAVVLLSGIQFVLDSRSGSQLDVKAPEVRESGFVICTCVIAVCFIFFTALHYTQAKLLSCRIVVPPITAKKIFVTYQF